MSPKLPPFFITLVNDSSFDLTPSASPSRELVGTIDLNFPK